MPPNDAPDFGAIDGLGVIAGNGFGRMTCSSSFTESVGGVDDSFPFKFVELSNSAASFLQIVRKEMLYGMDRQYKFVPH